MSYEDDCRRARDLLAPAQFAEIDALLEILQSRFREDTEDRRLWDRIERARKWCQS